MSKKMTIKLSGAIVIVPLVPVGFSDLFSKLAGADVIDNTASGKAISLVCDFETVEQAQEIQGKIAGQSFLFSHGNTITTKNN